MALVCKVNHFPRKTMSKINATKVFYHLNTGAVFFSKPKTYRPKSWMIFDSRAEFDCWKYIKKITDECPDLRLVVHYPFVLLEGSVPLVSRIDFCLIDRESNSAILLLEYKGKWIWEEPSATTLLNYQLNLISRIGIPYILVSDFGNLLNPKSPYKPMETSMSFLDKKIKKIIKERNSRCK
jgi:hypothetical protein